MSPKDLDEVLICPSDEYDPLAMRATPLETEGMNRLHAHKNVGLFIELSIFWSN